jgi:hypothetical protein
MAKSKSRKKKSPKRDLALPDLEHAKTAVLNSLTSSSAQRTYEHAIREFVVWYCSEPRLTFNRIVVLRYRIHLEQRGYAPATINLRLAAVRRVAYEAADSGLLSPELAAGVRRVRGVRRIGVRLGNWPLVPTGVFVNVIAHVSGAVCLDSWCKPIASRTGPVRSTYGVRAAAARASTAPRSTTPHARRSPFQLHSRPPRQRLPSSLVIESVSASASGCSADVVRRDTSDER